MHRKILDARLLAAVVACALAACGGGGGGPPAAPPQISLQASLATVPVGHPTMLVWTTTPLADECQASGAWSGSLKGEGAMAVTVPGAGIHGYVLTCNAQGATAQASVQLEAVAPVVLAAVSLPSAPAVIAGYPPRVSAVAEGSPSNVASALAGGVSIYSEDFSAQRRATHNAGRWYYYPTSTAPTVCGAAPFLAGTASREGCLAWFDAQPGPGLGSSQPFLRSRSPWWVDPNHRHAEPAYNTPGVNLTPGLGYINVLAFVNLPTAIQTPADLLEATVHMKLRKDAAFATLEASSRVGRRKGHVYFWFQTVARNLDASVCTPDPKIGENCTRQSDYILADSELVDAGYQIDSQLTADAWSRVSVRLSADPRHWTCLGRGDNVKYDCMPVGQALRNVDYMGLIIAPVCTAPDPFDRAVYTCPWHAPNAAANSNRGTLDVADVAVVAPLAQSVAWSELAQASAPGGAGALVKSGAAGAAWDAGAASGQSVAEGPLSLEFEVADTTGSRVVGLTHDFRPGDPKALDFAFALEAGGALSTSEAGAAFALPAPHNVYRPGDRLRIHVESADEGGRVLYFRNDELLPERPRGGMAPVLVYPMRAAAALYTPGATLQRAALHAPQWRLALAPAWQPAGATSSSFPPGQTGRVVTASAAGVLGGILGHVEFTAGDLAGAKAIGLAAADAAVGAPLAFSLYLQDGGVEVVESGVYRATLAGPLLAGDSLRIGVENEPGGAVVKYFKNYTPGTAPFRTVSAGAVALKPGAAAYDGPSAIGGVTWQSAGETVEWDPAALGSNVAGPAGRLTRTQTANGEWGAASTTTRAIATGDGYVEFTVPDTHKYLRLGLGTPYSGSDMNLLGFHLYVPSLDAGNADLLVFEPAPDGLSSKVRAVGWYAAGDRLRVGIEDGRRTYRRNGVLLYQSPARVDASVYPLAVNASLFSTGASVDKVVIVGGQVDAAR